MAARIQVRCVCTSCDNMGGNPTGLWLEELATPYYRFREAGLDVRIVSVKGGKIPVDAGSRHGEFYTPKARQFDEDREAQREFENSATVRDLLEEVKAEQIDAVFLCGGHGAVVDFLDSNLTEALEQLNLQPNKAIAGVCHGVLGLAKAKGKDRKPLVLGRKFSAFTDTEESAVQLTGKVKQHLEGKTLCETLRGLGGEQSHGEDWHAHHVVCTKAGTALITGQNPMSSAAVADALVKFLKSRRGRKTRCGGDCFAGCAAM